MTLHCPTYIDCDPESILTAAREAFPDHECKLQALAAGTKRRSRRVPCRNCGAHQTPQWRSGPEGPRTLCNACGVRFKKGLPLISVVPEGSLPPLPGALSGLPAQAATPDSVDAEPSTEAAAEDSSGTIKGIPSPSRAPSDLPRVPSQAATPDSVDAEHSFEAAAEDSSGSDSGLPEPLAHTCEPTVGEPAEAAAPDHMDTEPSIEAAVEGSSAATSGMPAPMAPSCAPSALPGVPEGAATPKPMDAEPSVEAAAEGSSVATAGMPAPLASSCVPTALPSVASQVATLGDPMNAEPSIEAAAKGSGGATAEMPMPLVPSCVPGSALPTREGGPLSLQQGDVNMATTASVASEPPQRQLTAAADSEFASQDKPSGECWGQGTVEPGNMAQTGQFFSRPYAACSQAVSCLRDALQLSRATGVLRLPGWAQLPGPRSPPALPDPDMPAAGQQPRLLHPWQPLQELRTSKLMVLSMDVNCITSYSACRS